MKLRHQDRIKLVLQCATVVLAALLAQPAAAQTTSLDATSPSEQTVALASTSQSAIAPAPTNAATVAGASVGPRPLPASAPAAPLARRLVVASANQQATLVGSTARQTNARIETPYWASVGGLEIDGRKTGYAFFGPSYVRPLRPGLALTTRFLASYLYYDFDAGTGPAKVRSRGFSATAGLRMGQTHWFSLQAGPSMKRRMSEAARPGRDPLFVDDIKVGLSLGANADLNPTLRNNIHAMFSYGTEDRSVQGRVAAKRQMSNPSWQNTITHYLGAELIDQGNEDIRSTQASGFLEILHVPSSVSILLRAGYRTSQSGVGPHKTGPWAAIGFSQRLQ